MEKQHMFSDVSHKAVRNYEVKINNLNAVAQLVEALCYKPEGCGFKSK
jgi:hypothetical protein